MHMFFSLVIKLGALRGSGPAELGHCKTAFRHSPASERCGLDEALATSSGNLASRVPLLAACQ